MSAGRPCPDQRRAASYVLTGVGAEVGLAVVLQLNQVEHDDVALDTVDFLLANTTAEGQAAVEEWFENDLDLPFTQDYDDVLYAEGTRPSSPRSRSSTMGPGTTNGDGYVLASTVPASVLFFAGISSVLRSNRTRFVQLVSGSVLWVGSAICMPTFPMTSLWPRSTDGRPLAEIDRGPARCRALVHPECSG